MPTYYPINEADGLSGDSRREILQNACTQIENAVSNLDELVQKSNQEEL